MGNISLKIHSINKKELDLIINATKEDIAQDYDMNNPYNVILANKELLDSFKYFTREDIEYVKTKMFVIKIK